MNIYDSQKWGVYIAGPGNVLAANTFEEATEKAAELNKIVVDHIKSNYSGGNYPIVFANVDRWENISKFEHSPSETDWENAFS